MFRTAVAGLRFHAARLAASSLAIAAGVAFVAGTLILGATMNQAFFNSFAAGARNVDAAVSPAGAAQPVKGRAGAPNAPSLAPGLLAEVARVPGAAAVAGRVVGQAPLIGTDGRMITNRGLPGFGISVPADRALWGFTLASGHAPTAPDQVLVDSSTAADEHFRLGQRIRVVSQGGRVLSFTLAGTMNLGAAHQFGNATVAGFLTPEAFAVTGRPGYDQIVARAAPGTSQAQLAARIKALPGLARDQVQTGSQLASAEATAAVHFTQQFTTLILIFALISLLVAAIVIYNTFRILAAQRTRELAMLRCVGASRRQVFTGMLIEAFAVGIAASVAGVIAGLGLGWGLERVFGAFGLPIPAAPLVLTPSAVAISIVLGVVVTLLAATLPAWAATKVAPVAALAAQAEPRVTRTVGWRRIAVAVLFGGGGLLLTAAGIQHATSGQSGFLEIAAGGMVFFVAVLALGPLIAPPVTSFFGWLPGRVLGAPARMATANARRNPHRVAATTAALTIGITLMTLFTVVASSAEASTTATIKEHYPFGYAVTSGQAESGTVPPRIVGALRAAPALGLVAPYYQRTARANGIATPVGALAGGGLAAISPPMTAGSLAAVRPGTAAVDAGQLAALHTRQDGTVTVSTPGAGTLRLRVVAVYQGANSPLPAVLLAAPDYLRGFHPTGAQAVYINAAPGVGTPRARAAVDRATAGDPLLQVTTVANYSSTLASRVNQVLALFAVLLGLAILIALLGIANTLSLSVIERTRETALLRALGLTRGQLRRMLLVEALLMALLGISVGVALGTGFGWAIVDAFIKSAGSGVFSVPYARIAIYVALGAVAGVAAALLPARRATSSSVVAAMAEA